MNMKKYQMIYHCISCGSIKKTDPEVSAPECCGQKMVKAAVDTAFDPDEHLWKADTRSVVDNNPGASGAGASGAGSTAK